MAVAYEGLSGAISATLLSPPRTEPKLSKQDAARLSDSTMRAADASSAATLPCPSSNALGQTAAFGTEALARLGLRLGSFQPMLQSSQFDGVAFDPFSLQKDGLASAEVDVGRR